MGKKAKFIVLSDLHCADKPRENKKKAIDRIIKELDETDDKIKLVIMPGDLTTSGYDGSKICCYEYGGDQDQLSVLHNQVVKPLESRARVYLCAGNHDDTQIFKGLRKPIFEYIKARHGGLRYEFGFYKKSEEQVLRFINLHIYPDMLSRCFLKKILETNPTHNYIIIFHYNPVGPHSEWWSEEEKKQFLKIISRYNIVAILVGHAHMSTIMNWEYTNPSTKNSEIYPVIFAAGDEYALCEYDHNTNELKVEFK